MSRIEIANEFLNQPEQAVKLFRKTIRPVKLTADGAKALLAKLFGDDKQEVLTALRELQVIDMQLESDFADLWAKADTATKRCRLVDAMKLWRSHPYRAIPDDFDIDARNAQTDYHFGRYPASEKREVDCELSSIWRVDVPAVQRIGSQPQGSENFGFNGRKGQNLDGRWYREESAIYILDAIGTDDAIAVIKDMATGHADAGPTKAAKDVLKRRGLK